MRVIDGQGNLFGVVNVVDALVVVLALGVVAAGVAVLGQADQPSESRAVTIQLDEQPAYVAGRISEGDVMDLGSQKLEITDVYVAPGGTEAASVTVAAEVTGERTPDQSTIRFDGDPVRPGRDLEIRTSDYAVAGTVTSVRDRSGRLAVETTTVSIRTTVDGEVANRIDDGDTYEIAGREVATVESVSVFPTLDGERQRAILALELSTIRDGSGLRFGSLPVKIGAVVPFATDEYDVNGTVLEQGGQGGDGATDTVTAAVRLENVEPAIADGIDVGDEERTRGATYARVTDKHVEPAVVVLTSVDGDIHQREHPRNKDVTLTVELRIRETPDGLRFHGDRLRQGDEVVLDFRTIEVNGTVVDLDAGA